MSIVKEHLEDRVLSLTLNRPEKRNAFSSELVAELKLKLSYAKDNPLVKVIIIKGEGEAFSAGADLSYLKQLQNNSFEENVADSTHLKELFEAIYHHPKIVIAQVEGFALAGGCGLATVCDFIFATPEAQFGFTEVKIGFIPAIVSFFVIRKLGEAKAKELLLTGKIISALDAQNIGLANEIYPKEEITQTTLKFALKICKEASQSALTLTKQIIAEQQHLDTESAMKYLAHKNAEARATNDCKKGIAAFLNKEKLSW